MADDKKKQGLEETPNQEQQDSETQSKGGQASYNQSGNLGQTEPGAQDQGNQNQFEDSSEISPMEKPQEEGLRETSSEK